jgi:alkyl sulfatase BDS1-like metallo-beta-lactamase superfamily hydrolase
MFIWIFIAASELTAESKPATQYTIDANQEVYALLDFEDTTEFENATKGLLCSYR